MAREPELSIKVKVDPVLDSEKLENDVQNQVKNIKNLPPVPIKPDTSGFKEAIENNLGGPYEVKITSTLEKNLTQQVNDEITSAQNGAQQLKVKLDVKEFGNDLSKQLKEQLRGVNRTLSNYLKEMQTNLALANKATYGLFSGGNRNVPVDSIFDEISKKDVKAVQTLTSQLDKVFEGLPKLKSAGKIDFENEIGSVEEFSSALSKMGTALQNMQAALNIYDQKQAKAAYSSAFDEFKKNYTNVQGISDVLNGIVNNSSALKNLDIKGSAQLKNFLVSLTDGITAVSSVKDIDVNNFDNLISVLDPDKFGELATNISEVTSQISISTGESKKKLEELKKAEEEAMGAGVPIDPSILDANTKKIIESIGNVSAAMTELETKSKNFSDNLTVEVDKNVSNIESRIKQLTGLVKFLPNGEENLLEGEKPKNKPAKPKKQNVDLDSKPEDKPENDSNGSTATVNKITFDVDIDELQKAVDVLFAKISAPIGFKPADGAIAAVKKTLEESLNGVEILNAIASKQTDNKDTDNSAQSIPVKGHITITDANVSSDVKNPIDIPVKATLKAENITVPETAVPIKIEAQLTETDVDATTKKSKKSKKTAKQSEQQSSVDLTDKIILEPKDITPPKTPVELKGHIDLTLDDISVPKKIPLNGELQITNATKEIKAATQKAQPKQTTAKTKNNSTDRDFERKSKELLTSLASIMKGKARVQNSLTNHNRKGQTEAAAEDTGYLANLSRRERTTKSKLTKLYKGHGGRSAWQNSTIYHSAQEDAAYIRNGRVAENSDKDKAAEEEKYIAALRQRPKLYMEIAEARRKYGNDSEYVKSAQKQLQNTLGVINQFESKVGKQHLQSMPERRNVFAENMSNLRKDREDKQKVNEKAQTKADDVANKARLDSEKEFLENLAKEPKLWADVEEARKKYGNSSAETKQAEYWKNKNKSALDNFKATHSGSLSDIPGYDDQIKENNLAIAAYQSGMTRKANEEKQKQHNVTQATFQKRRDEAQKNDVDAINIAKRKYLDAYDSVQKKREELSKTDDAATKQMIQNAIAVQRGIMKSAGSDINSYGKKYGSLVSDAWDEISAHRNDSQIKSQLTYEMKSDKEAIATKKENLNLLKQYNQSLNEELKLLKQVYAAETAEGKAAAQNALDDQKDKTETLRKQLKGKGLDATPDYQKYNTQNALNEAAINAKYTGTSIEDLKNTYIKNLRDREANINAAYSTEDADKIARITQRIEDNNKAIQEAGFALTQFGQKANSAWAEISKVNDELDITAEQKFNKALESQTKQAEAQAKKTLSENEKLLNRIERTMRNQEKAYNDYRSSEDGTQDKETKLGRLNIRNEELKGLRQQAGTRGLTVMPEYLTLEKQHREEILGIDEALQKRTEAEQEAIRVQDEDRLSLLNYIKTVEKYKSRLEQDNHTDDAVYGDSIKMTNAGWDLLSELNKNSTDKNQVAYLWGKKYNIQGVTDLESAFKALAVEAAKAGIKVQDLRTETEKFRAETQAKTNIANLRSQLSDYLEKFPKVSSGLADEVQKLQNALADPNAYKNAGRLKQAMAELRAQAKSLGLESENLIDKFQKLFGQHLSTMITMAALHKMQDALCIVYQNVVEIDTAVTELRKVSEYAGKSLEEYMGRAAEQAQKLGVSISDYINSTADWKRLGYSDEDAENLATYSTLLKNVGDGIDDVNTSSSYLISTLQGFGLLADQAEDVVNKIDAVANTQPVTANDLGEILTRSSAAMSAANNTLEETIALGTAANAVIQDADTVGTTLKSLSMYLRAAKTDAENAGIEVDGMANSVSELRSELKSLTGVDVMLDSKNFKSTYQIMKELSQDWGNLSDVTQANVTELIGGKRNANAVSAILNNFSVAESAMESAANSANVAWEENEKYLDSIQGRLAQLDASFQALSTDILSSDLVKTGISFLTTVVKLIDKLVNLTGALPLGLGITSFATQLGEPK